MERIFIFHENLLSSISNLDINSLQTFSVCFTSLNKNEFIVFWFSSEIYSFQTDLLVFFVCFSDHQNTTTHTSFTFQIMYSLANNLSFSLSTCENILIVLLCFPYVRSLSAIFTFNSSLFRKLSSLMLHLKGGSYRLPSPPKLCFLLRVADRL